MALFFKHKAKSKPEEKVLMHDKLAKSMAESLIRWQISWAVWMQRKTETLSRTHKLFVLSLMTVSSGAYFICLISAGFLETPAQSFSVTQLKAPGIRLQTGNDPIHTSLFSKEQHERVHKFSIYMDSLAESTTGIRLHDSILAAHPGLPDSIKLLENSYHSQISPIKK